MTDNTGIYARALDRFRKEFLILQKGKTFSYDDVVRYFQLDKKPNAQEAKHALSEVLYNLTHVNKQPELELVSKKQYRMIERTLNEIEWWKNKERVTLPIRWPYGVEDTTEFGFEDSITIYPGDVIGLAGEGNKGKTCLALNFLLNNLKLFPTSIYFTSEFNEAKFRDRIKYFDWIEYMNGNGEPLFRLAKHEENFQDVIVSDGLNVIDWVDMPDEPWKIGQIFKKASEAVKTGIVFICMQKRSYKKFAVGGESAMDYASAFFSIIYDQDLSSNVLKVEKVKTPGKTKNCNYKKYKFAIQNGAKLFAIEEIK